MVPLLAAAAAGVASAASPAAADAARPRVTVIGDSVAASLHYAPGAVRLLGRGLDLRLDLRVCRRLAGPSCAFQGAAPASALEVVRSRGDGLGRVVVIKVGYNEGSAGYARGMADVMAALRRARVRSVVWVTLTEERSVYASTNAVIRAAARRSPRMCVADWARASRGRPWFGSDGLHLNTAGATGLARLVRPYVVRAVRTGSCRPGGGRAPATPVPQGPPPTPSPAG